MNQIPRIIHYCWFGEKELPEKVQRCISSWKKYCPDYKICRWDESNYNYEKNKFMYEAYENKKWAYVSDYARFDILYQNGGIFLDTDVELIKNLDDLLEEKCFMGFENHYVAPGLIIGAQTGVLELKEIMELYESIAFISENGTLNLKTSPKYITQYLEKRGLDKSGKQQTVGNITIYPQDYFCPKNMLTGKCHVTQNTYSIHHYDGSWMGEKEKLEFERQARLREKNIWQWRIYNGIKVWKEEGLSGLLKKIKYMEKGQ